MLVKAWNNGYHHSNGNGYGLKISPADRDSYFYREWKTILLELDGESNDIKVNIDKDSFWNKSCRELISVDIGKWLIKHKLAPWQKGNPPTLNLGQIEGRRFRLSTK